MHIEHNALNSFLVALAGTYMILVIPILMILIDKMMSEKDKKK